MHESSPVIVKTISDNPTWASSDDTDDGEGLFTANPSHISGPKDHKSDEDDEEDDFFFDMDEAHQDKPRDDTAMDLDGEDGHDEEEEEDDDDDDDDDDDELSRLRQHLGLHMPGLFGNGLLGNGGQFRNILNNLNNSEEPTQQLIALQELAETLSISNEETLLGLFPCDAFVKALVKIMKGPEMDEDMLLALAMSEQDGDGLGLQGGNPEMILLACRCLSNLLDVLPSAASSVTSNGAIQLLCDKLKSIQYIDLAEQALGALEKVASHVPRSVVQEQGISAALAFFDFFSIHSQRTALKTAAHCMRNIDTSALPQILEILPTLRNTLTYSDRTVVELTCLCWARLAESFRHHRTCLEQVLSVDLLQSMLSLLPISGNVNAVRQGAFHDLLRVLRSVSKASPALGYELLKLDMVTYFYKILTGHLDLPDPEHASALSLDTKWHDFTLLILKITIDLLPPLPKDGPFSRKRFQDMEPVALRTRSAKHHQLPPAATSGMALPSSASSSQTQTSPGMNSRAPTPSSVSSSQSQPTLPPANDACSPDPRIQQLKDNPALLQRIGSTLFPMLLEIHASSVHLSVRQLVTHLLVKLVYFMDASILRPVLANVPMSGFLVGLLAQQERSTFVMDTLYQVEFLLDKLPEVYVSLFHREGVYYEINDLARKSLSEDPPVPATPAAVSPASSSLMPSLPFDSDTNSESGRSQVQTPTSSQEEPDSLNRLQSHLPSSGSRHHHPSPLSRQAHDTSLLYPFRISRLQHQDASAAEDAPGIGHGLARRSIIQLAQSIIKQYTAASEAMESTDAIDTSSLQRWQHSAQQLRHGTCDLAQLVSDMTTYGLSSFELLKSGLLDALLAYVTQDDLQQDSLGPSLPLAQRRQALCDIFKSTMVLEGGVMVAPALALLVKRLQELFTRFERFEVVTPLSTSSDTASASYNDSQRNPVQWLAKNIRLRLSGQGPDLPSEYQQLMVATHAVATFQVLEDYLLPRIEKSQYLKDLMQQNKADSSDELDVDEQDVLKVTAASTRRERRSQASTSTSAEQQKWKIQFTINNQPVALTSTIYGALHQSYLQQQAAISRRHHAHQPPSTPPPIWTQTNVVNYRRVPASEVPDASASPSANAATVTVPKQMASKGSPCMKILQLLQALVTLWHPWQDQDSVNVQPLLPPSQFINRKLAAKMQRQLEEPLIVASGCLPDWVGYFMHDFPFLFPFDVRYLYLQSTSFGYSRLITRWQNLQSRNNTQNGQSRVDRAESSQRDQQQQYPMLGRMERRKVMIRRDQILEYTIKIMDLFGSSPSILEIEYTDEEGTGLGPTLEFYALASQSFCKASTNMWRPLSSPSDTDPALAPEDAFVDTPHGLFPAALCKRQAVKYRKKVIQLFKSLGQFVAKAMLDFRIIDIPFSTSFFKLLLQPNVDLMSLIKELDPMLGKSLAHLQNFVDKKLLIRADPSLSATEKAAQIKDIVVDGACLEDLCLDFTLPGQPDVELKRHGSHIAVTIQNIEEYLQLLVDMIAGTGVQEQIGAFRDGFNGLFSMEDLHVLTYQELVSLFGSSDEDWSYATLADTIKADHGYTMESATIQYLLEILSEMTTQERRDFLQFTTGSPRLPLGGKKNSLCLRGPDCLTPFFFK
ncbi:hypothetical protein DM01DRAFT_1339048 [Hesseltinella vesiculosa]|uniref:HECT-type E3 ubiquitin transferase n=1 Tax=Hesseltinella vesiculosa TaxID=101127 RepID=A0A1X2G7Z1_9FUNG|nr:hypothetical protein DM01DRAFT_1339048 [Hesseltinella vesiculosa]